MYAAANTSLPSPRQRHINPRTSEHDAERPCRYLRVPIKLGTEICEGGRLPQWSSKGLLRHRSSIVKAGLQVLDATIDPPALDDRRDGSAHHLEAVATRRLRIARQYRLR